MIKTTTDVIVAKSCSWCYTWQRWYKQWWWSRVNVIALVVVLIFVPTNGTIGRAIKRQRSAVSVSQLGEQLLLPDAVVSFQQLLVVPCIKMLVPDSQPCPYNNKVDIPWEN
jgi:hypothetical protein